MIALPSRPSSLAALLLSIGLCMTIHGAALAQDPSRSVQEALRKRGFFYGEATGTLDEQTRAALKRFQIREGLTVTGEPDAPTLKALQKPITAASNSAPAPAAAQGPARERARSMVQSDQEFLARVEDVELQQAAAETAPVAPPPSAPARASAPPAAVEQRAPEPQRVERPAVERREIERPQTVERSTIERPAAERSVVETRTVETRSVAPPPSEPRQSISEADAQRFVQSYLQAAEAPTPEREVGFYADRVDYFDSGKVDRDFIRRDQANYYRKWPSRNFKLTNQPEVEVVGDDTATVRFRLQYALRNDEQSAKGETENLVRVRRTDGGLKIVSIRERRVKD